MIILPSGQNSVRLTLSYLYKRSLLQAGLQIKKALLFCLFCFRLGKWVYKVLVWYLNKCWINANILPLPRKSFACNPLYSAELIKLAPSKSIFAHRVLKCATNVPLDSHLNSFFSWIIKEAKLFPFNSNKDLESRLNRLIFNLYFNLSKNK